MSTSTSPTTSTKSNSQNRAAYQLTAKSTTLEVRDAPYILPQGHELLVRNHAVAINPIDWIVQQIGTSFIFQWLKYPIIMGYDVAGEIVSVGSKVTRFKPGDRVIGLAAGHDEKINRPEEAAFQLFTILREDMTTPIPASLSFEHGVVIPLGAATAACGLYQADQLNLTLPSLNPTPTGKTILIWGGSSSVGMAAIQLAVASGYEVITTCSPRNFPLVQKLGAASAFDYSSKTCVADIVAALVGKHLGGALSMGDGAVDAIMDVMCACSEPNRALSTNKFIAVATKSALPGKDEGFAMAKVVYNNLTFTGSLWLKSKARGIGYRFIFADTLVHDGVGKAVFSDYLPKALEEGKYAVLPEPMIVGNGLESVQAAFEVQRKGVSAKKVVVTL